MHCGHWFSQVAPAGQLQAATPMAGVPGAAPFAPQAGSRKRGAALAIIMAAAIVALGVWGLNAAGLLKLGAKASGGDLRAQGSTPSGDLRVPGNVEAGDLRAEGTAPDQDLLSAQGSRPETPLLNMGGEAPPPVLKRGDIAMPEDIRTWLEHLERIERRKVDLSARQLAAMQMLLNEFLSRGMDINGLLGEAEGEEGVIQEEGDPSKASKARQEFRSLIPEWQQLIKDFRSLPPPEECKTIANDYGRAINEIPGMTSDIIQTLETAMSNPQTALASLYKLQNSSAGSIDRYFENADEGIEEVCERYKTRKWFSVKSDIGGGVGRIPGF